MPGLAFFSGLFAKQVDFFALLWKKGGYCGMVCNILREVCKGTLTRRGGTCAIMLTEQAETGDNGLLLDLWLLLS